MTSFVLDFFFRNVKNKYEKRKAPLISRGLFGVIFNPKSSEIAWYLRNFAVDNAIILKKNKKIESAQAIVRDADLSLNAVLFNITARPQMIRP